MDELEIMQYKQVNGINIFLNTVVYRSPHFHQDWELIWLLDAPLTVNYMQQTYVLEPGEAAIFPPNATHELIRLRQECTFLCLQISSGLFPDSGSYTIGDPSIRRYLTAEDFDRVRRTMLDIAGAYFYRGDHYELLCCGKAALLLYELLTTLPFRRLSAEEAADIARQNARLLRLVDFVETNYSRKLRLADFAEQEGCSISYLSHFIRAAMNQTFHEYVDSVRFNAACRMIAEGKESMLSICTDAGFSDYRYFSRAFQRAFGMTPAQYGRQEHVLPHQEPHSRSFQSRELLMTRNQSLFHLHRFEEQLAGG